MSEKREIWISAKSSVGQVPDPHQCAPIEQYGLENESRTQGPGDGGADPYLRPAFSVGNRLRRACWAFSWFLLFRFTPVPCFGWRSMLLRAFGAAIGPKNFIYPSAWIFAPWLMKTEAVVTIGRGAEIYNPGGVVLAHHSIVSQNAYLCGASHDYDDPEFPFESRPIALGPYSWIGARAIVLPGVTVGEGSVLGAGAVTARSLDPWWVYAGNPARRIKPRRKPDSLEERGQS